MTSAQKYNAQTRREAAEAGKRQIEDCKKVLEANQRDAEDHLKATRSEYELIKEATGKLEQRKVILEDNMAASADKLTAATKTQTELDSLVQQANDALETIEHDKKDVEAEVEALRAQVARYSGEQTAFQAEIARLSAHRDAIKAEIEDFTINWDISLTEKRREVGVLESKRDTLAAESLQLSHDMEMQREDLARRIVAANDREQVIARREMKVRRDEADSARNQSLMQL